MAGLRSYLNFPLADVPTAIRTGQTDAMLNVGFLNVMLPPYNASNTGSVNVTTAFQTALNDGYNYNFAVYVPKGSYLLNQLSIYQIADYRNFGGSNRKHAMQLIGDTTGGNAPTLIANTGLGANPLLNVFFDGDLQFGAARIYNTLIRGFRINMQNNPTGFGIGFEAAQWCSLEDIEIFGTAFAAGLRNLPGSGGSTTNVKITGGTTGILFTGTTDAGGVELTTGYRPTPSVQNCELINQTGQAVLNNSTRGAAIFAGFQGTRQRRQLCGVQDNRPLGTVCAVEELRLGGWFD